MQEGSVDFSREEDRPIPAVCDLEIGFIIGDQQDILTESGDVLEELFQEPMSLDDWERAAFDGLPASISV
jgi:hypothetical protein